MASANADWVGSLSLGHLSPPQMAIGHLRLAAICDFYNVQKLNVLAIHCDGNNENKWKSSM